MPPYGPRQTSETLDALELLIRAELVLGPRSARELYENLPNRYAFRVVQSALKRAQIGGRLAYDRASDSWRL